MDPQQVAELLRILSEIRHEFQQIRSELSSIDGYLAHMAL